MTIRALLILVFFATSASAAPSMDVLATLGSLEDGFLAIELSVHDWPSAQIVFRDVPTYVDNPMSDADGEIVRHVRCVSGDRELTPNLVELSGGEMGYAFDDVESEIVLKYRLHPAFEESEYTERYPIKEPFLDSEAAWLLGNHIFLGPELDEDRVTCLRQAFPVRLRVEAPDSIELIGLPSAGVELRNLHELMAVQFGLGDYEILEGKSSAWPWQIALHPPSGFTFEEKEMLVHRMHTMVDLALKLFGGAPFEWVTLGVFRIESSIGGLEGAYACQVYVMDYVDLADTEAGFSMAMYGVAMHELVHSWFALSLFPLDDPWWKEGVTSYYGNVLAARAGWIGTAEVLRLMEDYEQKVFGGEGLESVALSDPRLWKNEYEGESWRLLTYDRGEAVALLLDVFLRESTENAGTLDDVMRTLQRDHARSAFSREQLLAAIKSSTGVDARGFFARYVDTVESPSSASVGRALKHAVELGVFDRSH